MINFTRKVKMIDVYENTLITDIAAQFDVREIHIRDSLGNKEIVKSLIENKNLAGK